MPDLSSEQPDQQWDIEQRDKDRDGNQGSGKLPIHIFQIGKDQRIETDWQSGIDDHHGSGDS